MHFVQMLLVFTALLALAYTYPTGSEQKSVNSAPNVTDTTHNVPEDKKPLTITVDDETPQTESVVVEFIYKSNGKNSISESKGKDKDKYNVESSLHKEGTQNLNENDKGKLSSKTIFTEAQKQVNEPQFDSRHRVNDPYMRTQTALTPQEVSPINENWPKYFYDAFHPIQPFPEIQYDEQNQIRTQKVKSENTNSYTSYNEKDKLMNVAGPLLSPLSIYDREFRVPTFD